MIHKSPFLLAMIVSALLGFMHQASAQMPTKTARTESAKAGADSWCRLPTAPKLIITPKAESTKYDFSKSKAQLNNFSVDTKNPYGTQVHTDVGGLMSGGITTNYVTRFDGIVDNKTDQTCIWFSEIKVNITIDPTIYVASDYPRGSCMHNAVMDHEKKHINVDRSLVNYYAQSIGKALGAELKRQAIYGPIPSAQGDKMQQDMHDRIAKVMKKEMDFLNTERRKRQQAVDSLAEYQRVNAQCPDQRR